MTERHVKRFVFGKLLPIRGVDNVWERRYGWHWVAESYDCYYCPWNKIEWKWKPVAWLKPDPFRQGYKTPPPEV